MEPDNYDAMNDADKILSVLRQTGPSVPSESSTKVTNDPRAVCGHDAVLWFHHLSCRDSVLLGALYFVSVSETESHAAPARCGHASHHAHAARDHGVRFLRLALSRRSAP
jgi:hypothetical protein